MSQEDLTYSVLTIAFLLLGLIFVAHYFGKFRKTNWDLIEHGKRTYNLFLLSFILLFVAIVMTAFEIGILMGL